MIYIIMVGLKHVKCLVTSTSFQGHSLVYYRISFEQVDVFFCQTCIDMSFGQFLELVRFW